MAKFKVGDEVAVAAIMKIAAIQPQSNGTVSYSTDRGITIPEHLMEQIALSPKEQKAEEPKPAPQPAHRFKVGDRVETEYGIGEIVYLCNKDFNIPYLVYNENWIGCSGYLAEGFDVQKYGMHCRWFCESNLSPAPAPEPPKFYTGKVFAVRAIGEWGVPDRVNRVFEIVNGSAGAYGEKYGIRESGYRSFEHFCEMCFGNEWREVKE